MGDDWQDLVIETGVDTLLNYLAENGTASASEISKDLGVSEKRIKEWSKALESNGFIERSYSARKGLVLKYTKENKEEVDEKLEEIKEEVDKEAKKAEKEITSRESEIDQKKKELEKLADKIKENQKQEEEIESKLENLKDLENEIEEKLSKEEKRREKVHSETLELLSRIDNTLNRIENAEETAEKFSTKSDEIKRKLKALKKLEKHAESVEELDKELEELKKQEEKSESIFKSFRNSVSSIFGSKDNEYQELLSRPVKEIKQEIKDNKDINNRKLLKAEKNGKNRETLKKYIKKQI